jgi:hypothetical protein
MKRSPLIIIVIFGFCFVFISGCVKKPAPGTELSDYDRSLLAVSSGVIQLFESDPAGIWPGFDLSSQPFIVYVAPRWVLLFNAEGEVPGFSSPPAHWPLPQKKVLYHEGRLGQLAGQLAFDFEIAGKKMTAVGMPEERPSGWENPEIRFFGFIVHESFHQFQFGHFGEIPWAREERYPILDRENSALAYIELRILMDALQASAAGESARMKELLALFTAVRSARWREEGSYITRYEQGQEIREGTARYVEMKSLDTFNSLLKGDGLTAPASSLKVPFASLSFPEYLLQDFRDRMAENHITPGNMLRNRIYPLGAALGFMADALEIDWKPGAQEAGEDFAFHRLFIDALGLDKRAFSAGLERAKALYDYAAVLDATGGSILTYEQGFAKDLAAFEDQEGVRIDLDFSYRGISRSRSSLGQSWVMENGGTSLCLNYRVYTLKSEGLELEVHNAGLLERNDWDGKHKTVSFAVPALSLITLNGEPFEGDGGAGFETLEIKGEGLGLRLDKPGRFVKEGNRIRIILEG